MICVFPEKEIHIEPPDVQDTTWGTAAGISASTSRSCIANCHGYCRCCVQARDQLNTLHCHHHHHPPPSTTIRHSLVPRQASAWPCLHCNIDRHWRQPRQPVRCRGTAMGWTMMVVMMMIFVIIIFYSIIIIYFIVLLHFIIYLLLFSVIVFCVFYLYHCSLVTNLCLMMAD